MSSTPEEAVRASALAAWDSVNLGTGQVHVVSLKPVLVRFFDEELHDPTPNRAAADAVTQA